MSRYLAQTSASGFAKAVISINSPHAGADIFNAGSRAMAKLSPVIFVANIIFSRRSLGAANVASIVSSKAPLTWILGTIGPVTNQMIPGSVFVTNLKNRNETFFRRCAIRSQVDPIWQSVRVYCDMRAPDSPGVPQGAHCVKDTKRTVKRVLFQSALVGLLSIASSCVPGLGGLSAGLAYAAVANGAALTVMFTIDLMWRWAFNGFAASDGSVTMSSQQWPGAITERVITGADSHVGSTKSALVRTQLTFLLDLANRP